MIKKPVLNLPAALNLISAAILIIGLGSAFWIYQQSDNQERRVLGYEITGGTAYPIEPEDSRKYLRELEQYGGKMALVGNDIERLFARLLHGKPLALIIAGFSIIISFGAFYAAGRLSSNTRPDAKGKQTQTRN